MSGLPLHTLDQTLTVLIEAVDRFVAAWERDGAPDPANYLPPTSTGDPSSDPVRKYVLVELIKADLEYRAELMPLVKPLEAYVEEHAELALDTLPAELIYEEFHQRKKAGEEVSPAEYFHRFPAQREQLADLLGEHDPYSSTRIGAEESAAHLNVSVGEELDEFQLLDELGRGSFARVFLARQRTMQRMVALKVSPIGGMEAEILAQLDHEGIVRVFDVRDRPNENLRLLYMQYMPGGTLQSVVSLVMGSGAERMSGEKLLGLIDESLKRRGAEVPSGSLIRRRLAGWTWPQCVAWIGSVLAEGLDYAHGHKVEHRDVKPANVLLSAEGLPKLADFNISFSDEVEGASAEASFGGSLTYMSPEQLRACHPGHAMGPADLDGRSDLYSLAVVLWELLTGRRPFGEEQTAATFFETLDELITRRDAGVDPSRLPADCPPGLSRALGRALSPERNRRHASCAEFARDLTLCLHPRAEAILAPPESRLRSFLVRHVVMVSFLCAVLPNGLAAWFNYVYNVAELIEPMPRAARAFFMTLQTIINMTAFPLGLTLAMLSVFGVCRWVRFAAEEDETRAGPAPAELRERCLRYGRVLVLLSVKLWFLAGLAYPIALHFKVGEIGGHEAAHFLISLIICGMLASGYAYFLATAAHLWLYYPILRAGRPSAPDDRASLLAIRKETTIYLWFGLAPMLGLFLLSAIGSDARFAHVILSLCGLAGFGLLLWLSRMLRDDVEALLELERDASAGSVWLR